MTGKKKLLIVDDVALNRLVLSELFREEYEMLEAENGEQALELIFRHVDDIAVILLDLLMPVMDGFEVLRQLNDSGIIKKVPVIMVTGETDDEKALTGYQLGVSDMIAKPFNPEIVCRRVSNVVDLYAHKNHLEHKLQEQKAILERQEKRLKETNMFLIDALSTTVEFRNFESGEHVKRIRELTKVLLESTKDEYGLSDQKIEAISNASALHDIGKIAIPDSVLLKPGRLTNEEFDVMKTHTVRGCEILETLNYIPDREYYTYCYEICRHHHERWDGRGYPDGLAGDDISIWAQVAAVADVYDALTSDRVYKKAYPHEKAVQMILDGECGAFNPALLDRFVEVQGIYLQRVGEINATSAHK